MATCPNGHQSHGSDWCEVCGHRLSAGTAPPGGGTAGGPDSCPQCGTPRETPGPFCEACRFNFDTNSPTVYQPPQPPPGYPQQPGGGGFVPHPVPPPPPAPPGAAPPAPDLPPSAGAPGQPFPGQPGAPVPAPPGPAPGQAPGPYSGAPEQPGAFPVPGAPPGGHDQGGLGGQGDDWMLPPPSEPAVPQPPAQPAPGSPTGGGTGGWLVTIAPDQAYFTAMMHRSGPEAAQLSLPAPGAERQVPLDGQQVTIGRRRQSTGHVPDIDLGQSPEDPGVSHQHAILVRQPDGSWAVVDQDSTNGTTVNGAEEPVQPYVPVPLTEGDRVHVGAWTTLTLYRG